LIEKLVLLVGEFDLLEIGNADWRNGDRVPKLAQRIDTTLRQIPGNDC